MEKSVRLTRLSTRYLRRSLYSPAEDRAHPPGFRGRLLGFLISVRLGVSACTPLGERALDQPRKVDLKVAFAVTVDHPVLYVAVVLVELDFAQHLKRISTRTVKPHVRVHLVKLNPVGVRNRRLRRGGVIVSAARRVLFAHRTKSTVRVSVPPHRGRRAVRGGGAGLRVRFNFTDDHR